MPQLLFCRSEQVIYLTLQFPICNVGIAHCFVLKEYCCEYILCSLYSSQILYFGDTVKISILHRFECKTHFVHNWLPAYPYVDIHMYIKIISVQHKVGYTKNCCSLGYTAEFDNFLLLIWHNAIMYSSKTFIMQMVLLCSMQMVLIYCYVLQSMGSLSLLVSIDSSERE